MVIIIIIQQQIVLAVVLVVKNDEDDDVYFCCCKIFLFSYWFRWWWWMWTSSDRRNMYWWTIRKADCVLSNPFFSFRLISEIHDALSSSVFFSHLVLHGGIIDRNKFIIVYFTVIQNKASRRLDQLELFFWFFVVNFACSTVAGTV